jgi:hypothetical protein
VLVEGSVADPHSLNPDRDPAFINESGSRDLMTKITKIKQIQLEKNSIFDFKKL